MQSKWNTWPQVPQAILRPSSEDPAGFAWYSILASWRLFLHIAQVSVQIDQDQTATADHCATVSSMVCLNCIHTFFSWKVGSMSWDIARRSIVEVRERALNLLLELFKLSHGSKGSNCGQVWYSQRNGCARSRRKRKGRFYSLSPLLRRGKQHSLVTPRTWLRNSGTALMLLDPLRVDEIKVGETISAPENYPDRLGRETL